MSVSDIVVSICVCACVRVWQTVGIDFIIVDTIEVYSLGSVVEVFASLLGTSVSNDAIGAFGVDAAFDVGTDSNVGAADVDAGAVAGDNADGDRSGSADSDVTEASVWTLEMSEETTINVIRGSEKYKSKSQIFCVP